MNQEYWIKKLNLLSHPEGGYYRETYRSEKSVPRNILGNGYKGERNFSTGIYYLLAGKDISCFHRIPSDEIWHFYSGTSSLIIPVIEPSGSIQFNQLGLEEGGLPQLVVPGGCWFGAYLKEETGFVLCGCTVSPGFDFADFEMGNRNKLIQQFPELRDSIEKLTRE